MVAVVADKVSGQTITVSGNNIVLSDPSKVTLNLSPKEIVSTVRSGNDLVIGLRNGQHIDIQNFYSGEGDERSELVLKDPAGHVWNGQYTDDLANFNFAESGGAVDQLGGAAAAGVASGGAGASILGIAAALGLAAGGIAIASGGSGGSKDNDADSDTSRPAAPTDLDVADDGLQLTGRGEPGTTVTVTDAAGDIVGTGTVGSDGTFTVDLKPGQTDGGSLDVTLTDAGGNISDPGHVVAPDGEAPDAPTDLDVNAAGAELTGHGEAGTKVTVTNAAGDVVGTGTVGADGTFTVTLDPAQTNGGDLEVTLTDAAGNTSAPGSTLAPDGDAPAAPTNLDVNDAGTELSGRGEAGATVTVKDADGHVVSTGTVAGNGTFEVALAPPQVDGGQLNVTQTDASGTSQPGTIASPDLTAPDAPVDLAVNAAGTALSGHGEAGTTVTVRDTTGHTLGTGTVGDDGTFSVTISPAQTDGETLNVTLTDAAGNVSAPGSTLAPDGDAPAAPTNLDVNDAGTELSGRGEAGATVTVKDADGHVVGTGTVAGNGTFEVALAPPQVDGGQLNVTQTDANGTSQPGTIASPDLTAPDGPTDLDINDTGTVLTGHGEPGTTATVTNSDGIVVGSAIVAINGTFSVTLSPAQADGGTLDVTLKDAAGNVSDPGIVSTPDLTPPDAATNVTVNDEGTVLTGHGDVGSTVTVTDATGTIVGTGTIGADGDFTVTINPAQTDGGALQVVLSDTSGNDSDPTTVLSPDLQPPAAAADLDINDDGTALTGRGEAGATVTVRDADGVTIATGTVGDDGTFSVALNPEQINGGVLGVVLTDAAGNASTPTTIIPDDFQPPQPATGLEVNVAGTELTGHGEPGAMVTVTNAAGDPIGEDTVNPDGTFTVALSPAQTDGGTLGVVLTDAAGNDSTSATVLAPDPDAPDAPTATINAEGTIVSGTGEVGATIRIYDEHGVTLGTGTVAAGGTYNITLDTAQTDGEELRVTQTDANGTSQPVTVLAPDLIPPEAPTNVSIDDSGNVVTGRGEVGTTVTVTNAAGVQVGTGTVGVNGTFSVTLTSPQVDGSALSVSLTDAGNHHSPAVSVTTPDLTAPDAPDGLAVSPDGTELTGQGEPGATVTATNSNGVVVGTGVADGDGNFSVALDPPQNNGGALTVTQEDTGGNVSDPATIQPGDTTAPDAATGLGVNAAGTLLTGSGEVGAIVTVTNADGDTVGTGTVGANGQFTIGLSPVQDDGSNLQVVLTDANGNDSAGASVATPDLVPPDQPTGIAIENGGTVLTGSGEPNATVTVTDPATGAVIGTGTVGPTGDFSVPLSPTQADGGTLQVVLTDAGNHASDPVTITVPDITAPDEPGALVVNATGTLLTGTGEPGTSVTVTNAAGDTVGTATVTAGGTFTVGLSPAQIDGGSLSVTLEDGAGHVSPAATVDTQDSLAPEPADDLAVGPTGATLTGVAEAGATVTVTNAAGTVVGTAIAGEDGQFSVNLAPVQTNGGELQVVVSDAAGNESPTETIAAVDIVAPVAPSDLTISADGSQLVGRGEPGATAIVTLADGTPVGEVTVGSNGVFTVPLNPAQSDGSDLHVVISDAAGNDSPEVSVATPDLVAPGDPTDVVIDASRGTLTGEGEAGATVTVRDGMGVVVGTGEVAQNGTFSITLDPPQTDAGSLQVTLADAAGNTSDPVSLTLTDIQPPDAPTNLVISQDGLTLTGVGEPGTIVEVRDGSGALLPTTGPVTVGIDGTFTATFSNPQLGGAALQVTLTDAADNVSLAATALTPDPDAPAAPGNLDVSGDGSELTGTGLAGATVLVTNAAGDQVGTGTVGVGGGFTVILNPAQDDGGDLRVTLTNANGTSQPGFIETPDLTAPDAPTNVAVADDGSAVTGRGEPGATVTVSAGGVEIGSAEVGANGGFSVPLDPAQIEGTTLSVVVADADGNAAAPVTLASPDLTPPDPADTLVLNGAATQLTGGGEVGATVTVTNAAGIVVGTGTVGTDGTFTIALSPAQTEGGNLSVVLEDAAGNASTPATVLAPDDLAPDAPTDLSVSANGTTLTGLGEAGATVTVTTSAGLALGTALVQPDGTFTVTLTTAQTAGAVLDVSQTDPSGNISDVATVASPDSTPPALAAGLDVDDTGTLVTGTGEAGATVTISNAAGVVVGEGIVGTNGQFSVGLSPAQIDGGTLSVVLTDADNNASGAATVPSPDLTDPSAPINLAVNPTGTSLTGQGDAGATVIVRDADGNQVGTTTIGTGGGFTVALSPTQADGGLLTVVVADAAGNISDPGTILTPDLTPPDAATGVQINPSGTEVTGTGEVGASVTITNADGTIVGEGTVGSNGQFSVGLSPSQVDGGQLSVVLEDAASNISTPATVVAPGLDFALSNVADTAVLDRTVTIVPEASPSQASASHYDLLGLNVGSLASVNLGQSAQPVVNFNVGTGNNEVALDLTISGLVGIGLLSSYTVIIERYQNGVWVRPSDLGNSVSNGILDLDLLGLGATHTELTLTDIPAGTYRATFVPDVGVSIGVSLTRAISVTATDVTDQVHVSVGENADGNFIGGSASGDTSDLRVSAVEFNGTDHTLANGSLSLEGQYGTLVMHGDGSYTYTPHTSAPDGATDTFGVTVVDTVTGNDLTADLSINIDVENGSTANTAMVASSDDVVSLAATDDLATDSDNAATASRSAETTTHTGTATTETASTETASSDAGTSTTADHAATSGDTVANAATHSDATETTASDATTQVQVPETTAAETTAADSTPDHAVTADVTLDAGGQEVDLSGLDNLSAEATTSAPVQTSTTASVDLPSDDSATSVDVGTSVSLEPINNTDDELANHRLPVV